LLSGVNIFIKATSQKSFSIVKIAQEFGCPPLGLAQLPGFTK
jgi:hypothetical protein